MHFSMAPRDVAAYLLNAASNPDSGTKSVTVVKAEAFTNASPVDRMKREEGFQLMHRNLCLGRTHVQGASPFEISTVAA